MTIMKTCSECDKSFSKGYNYKRHIQKFQNNHFGKEAVPLPFEAASTGCVSGATKSGKTTWLFRLLRNKNVMFSELVNKILYCYGIYQDTFDSMKREVEGIEFLEGIPSQAEVDPATLRLTSFSPQDDLNAMDSKMLIS